MIKRVFILFLTFLVVLFPALQINGDDDPKKTVQVVVLDAGHGGKDPGALGKKSREKDIVLSITLKVGKYIEENFEDVKVIYTRKKDEFIELHKRADIANSNKADLFISIHANGSYQTSAYGTETFVLGTANNEKNLEVVMAENSVIELEEDYTSNYEGFDPNSIESYIAFTLMQSTYLLQSLQFASFVQDQFRDRVKRHDRGVKQQIFVVLWKTTMPSVLIETGFITNTTEEKYLMSDDGQTYLASAIFRAFKEYKEEIESKSVFTAIPHDDPDPEPESPEQSENLFQEGIFFTVQIASSTRELKENHEIFTTFEKVYTFTKESTYKYTVGRFTRYENALEYSREVRTQVNGAFVIAIKNNKIIPVKEALDALN
ncbi:MAG: N-acetylmuramoyl-L-alanine amidase [Bacteroidales bacterium]|nr:N-acetylmuramoyl-L-alanine amidase [Bacteroidales bacterium]